MKYETLQEKLEILKDIPCRGIPEDEMKKVRKRLKEQCPKSIEKYKEMANMIPGGSQHQLAIRDPFVITMEKNLGSKMWDIDGNEYVDYLMSAGACILGHSFPPLKNELVNVLDKLDPNTYWNTDWERKAIKSIKEHMPSIEKMQYFQSGTEADMAALRIARVFTGNKKVIKFSGSYHGWSDQLTYDIHIPHSGTMESDGIPRGCYKNTISVPPNDLEALEENLKKYSSRRSGVAAILVEPLGAESGSIAIKPGLNKRVRELCDQYDALLIFDEVVTGFRMGLGGAQEYFDIKPDLTVFGKILTHGYPSTGAVGGRADIMDVVTGDVEAGGNHAFVGGTLRGNPLSVAATYWTIKLIEDNNAIEKAAKSADDLVGKLNKLFKEHDRPYFAYNYKSCVHFETFCPLAMDIRNANNIPKAVKRKEAVDNLATFLLSKGVITKYGNRAFTCMSHSEEDNDKFVKAFEEALKVIPK